MVKSSMRDCQEELAALEHEQWVEWSKAVACEVSDERVLRWRKYWKPYSELDDDVKAKDRNWALRVLKIIDKLYYR